MIGWDFMLENQFWLKVVIWTCAEVQVAAWDA
jgi:hypothetical protein